MIPNFELKNNIKAPAIGLGTFLIKDGDQVANCVKDAVRVGYRSFDTAMIYLNEKGVGQGIKECGISREELYITTKLWNDSHGYEKVHVALEASLKRLGLDYIDEYLMHWPGLEEQFISTWKAMEELYIDKKIKVIGVCNFSKRLLQILLKNCNIAPMINQLEVHPIFQPNDAIAFCQENGIQVEAWRPILWGKLEKEPILSMVKKYKKTPVQIALRWLYQRNIRSLPKASSKEHMMENINIFDFNLDNVDLIKINEMNTFVRTGEAPDEFFETSEF